MNNDKSIRKLIRLGDLIGYLDCDEEIKLIIKGEDSGWDDYTQLKARSLLLKPYADWFIVELGIEEAGISSNVLRVMIEDIGAE